MAAADLLIPAPSPSLLPSVDPTRPITPSAEPLDRVAEVARPALGVVEQLDLLLTFQEATRRFQRTLLTSHLDATRWNVAETARRLDLARSHVYNLMDAMEIERPAGIRGSRRRRASHD